MKRLKKRNGKTESGKFDRKKIENVGYMSEICSNRSKPEILRKTVKFFIFFFSDVFHLSEGSRNVKSELELFNHVENFTGKYVEYLMEVPEIEKIETFS